MSAKAIREYDAKLLLNHWLLRSPSVAKSSTATKFTPLPPKVAQVNFDTTVLEDGTNALEAKQAFDSHVAQVFHNVESTYPWLTAADAPPLVVKPDQLIKRRGKSGLLLLKATWPQVKQWILERAGKQVKVGDINDF